MLPCAPYFKNICNSVQLKSDDGNSPKQSPKRSSVTKKQTEVIVTDVTSVKVDLLEESDEVIECIDEESVKAVTSDVSKFLTTFKPESPDVTRAAKKLEREQKLHLPEDVDEILVAEDIPEQKEEVDAACLGAISKNSKR